MDQEGGRYQSIAIQSVILSPRDEGSLANASTSRTSLEILRYAARRTFGFQNDNGLGGDG